MQSIFQIITFVFSTGCELVLNQADLKPLLKTGLPSKRDVKLTLDNLDGKSDLKQLRLNMFLD